MENADNPRYGKSGGRDTEDRVFLLSLWEAEKYFEDDEDRRTFPTVYAIAQDVYVNSDLGTVWWWLRRRTTIVIKPRKSTRVARSSTMVSMFPAGAQSVPLSGLK